MSMMMPRFIPYKMQLVYLTGFIEIAAAVGLLIPSLRHTTALLLIIFFVLVLPVNINAAVHRVDYEKPGRQGKGPSYLWFRAPLQVFFILWVWYFSYR